MNQRAYNFNAGPAALPLEVLQEAEKEFINFKGTGMSLMEMSHRGKIYEAIHMDTMAQMKSLLNIPDSYRILLLQGGGSTQFAMIPQNLLSAGSTAAYIATGSWAEKAIQEASLIGNTEIIASSENKDWREIPDLSNIEVDKRYSYVHLTSNETIEGTQFQNYPLIKDVPLVGDLSSDIMSRPIDVSRFGIIYAGAQKNLGPSGVTVVIIREDLIESENKHLPTMSRFSTHAKANSLYNTPPVYSIYIMGLMMHWLNKQGGLEQVAANNRKKAQFIYNQIDQSSGFYEGCAALNSRSLMNITFRLQTPELEAEFLEKAESEGFIGLKGHRSVGGLRASTYNAVPYESCVALAQFMHHFKTQHA